MRRPPSQIESESLVIAAATGILVAAFLQERDQFGEGVGRTKNAFADHKEFVLGHHAALRLREAAASTAA
ncbi:hypothetical protein AP071_07050 [Rhodobacter capsulatus]|nr:hypothetical protein AP071_07050 [Rhodobacter capsulatus]KQB16691.1 hypothetical protein AP073_10375 [Rhodobacter capsulatus]